VQVSVALPIGLIARALCLLTRTTVIWKVTPLFAEWIASPNFLFQRGYLSPNSTALELGAGVSGVVALTLGPKIAKYIATDQDYVLRLLKQNIAENLPAVRTKPMKRNNANGKRSKQANEHAQSNIVTLQLDWESDSVSSLPALLGQGQANGEKISDGVDLIIACDCIYNDALIEPFNSTCVQLCGLRPEEHGKPTICLVAQQLRSSEVFESWLKSFHRSHHVWRIPDEFLTESLQENSGFVVHIGILR
jgi:hypothetical protein